MKLAPDTSVLVAAFASWHEHHEVAFETLGRVDAVVAHCLLETYSVLTRLPAPHRMTAEVVSRFLDESFARHEIISLPPAAQRDLVTGCAALGIAGGSVYDALIGATCANAGCKLVTLDGRARQTYAALGVSHQMLA